MKKKIFQKGFILLLAGLFLSPVPVLSETTGGEDTTGETEKRQVFDLGEIVVVGEQDEEPEAGNVVELTIEDMELRDARTVADALEFVPGVTVTYGSKNEAEVLLRGFAQEKVIVLLDGVPIYSPYFGDVDLSQIPVADVAKITVIKGAASPFYGPNSLGGVINIVTKKPTEKPSVDFLAQVAENSTYRIDFSHGLRKNNFYYQLGGNFHQSDGWNLSDDFEPTDNQESNLRDNSWAENMGFNLKVGGDWDEAGEVALNFSYIDAEKGVPPSTVEDSPRYRKFPEWKQWTLSGLARRHFNDTVSMYGNLFYHKYDNVLVDYDDPDYMDVNWVSTFDDFAAGGMFYTNFAFSAWDLQTGFNFIRDNHKDQSDIGDPWQQYIMNTYSFIAEGTVPFSPEWKLVASASLDVLDQVMGAEDNPPGPNKTAFNPLATLYYNPGPEHVFHATLAQKTRFPTMNQLYSSRSGNPDLDPQKNVDIEAGYQYTYQEVHASIFINVFYNRVRDLIDRLSRDDPYENIADASIFGIETGISARPCSWLELGGDYTYLSTEDISDVPTFDQLPLIPGNRVNLSGKVTAPFGTMVSAIGQFSGKRYEYDRDNNKMEVPGFEIMNLRVEQQFYDDFRLYLYISNLFDASYYTEIGYPRAGRAFIGGLTLFFN